jgi:serine protease Do
VVADADRITLVLADGSRVEADLLGGDASMDVALLKASAVGGRTFTHVPLGDSDHLEVGDWVVAMGNGLGLGPTVTAGIVSGKGRVLGHDALGREAYIQTDAAINQGNSGGPLFDLDGRVVGMSTAIIAGANTVGFAIPSNVISSILEDLRTNGRVARGFLGVQQQTLNEELRRELGVQAAKGALVTSVFDDTPASRSGLRTGDVVVEVDGQPVETDTDLIARIGNRRPGDKVVLKIERNSRIEEIRVTLAERPGEARVSAPITTPEPQTAVARLGLALAPLPASDATRLGLKAGVRVDGVTAGSAADGRLAPGDVIVQVDRHPVDSPSDVEKLLSRSGETAHLLILRGDAHQFVALTVP